MEVVNYYAIEASYPGWRTDPRYVYIGRNRQLKYVGKETQGWTEIFCNPHFVGMCWTCNAGQPHEVPDIVHTRDEAIELFRSNTEKKKVVMEHKEFLKGKILVCFCAPKACHGDVIIEWVEGSQQKLF